MKEEGNISPEIEPNLEKKWLEALLKLASIHQISSKKWLNICTELEQKTKPRHKPRLVIIASHHNGGASTALALAYNLELEVLRQYSTLKLPNSSFHDFATISEAAMKAGIDSGWIHKNHAQGYTTAINPEVLLKQIDASKETVCIHTGLSTAKEVLELLLKENKLKLGVDARIMYLLPPNLKVLKQRCRKKARQIARDTGTEPQINYQVRRGLDGYKELERLANGYQFESIISYVVFSDTRHVSDWLRDTCLYAPPFREPSRFKKRS